jgi:hypothetical protein
MGRVQESLFNETAPCLLINDRNRDLMNEANLAGCRRFADVISHERGRL